MATCSAYAINAFLNVSDQANLIKNTSIQNSTTPAFRPFFAEQATFTLVNNIITTDSYNTISYRGTIYSLYDIQICTPVVHITNNNVATYSNGRGIYTIGTPAAELVLTFQNPSRGLNQPTVIVVILPIYETNQETPNIVSDIIQHTMTPHSLIDLFNENSISYGYNACISTVNSPTDRTINGSIPTYILSFPNGVSIPQKDINQLTNLQPYTFYPARGLLIVTLFQYNETTNTYVAATLDPTTFYATTTTSSDDTITKNIICYTKSPSSIVKETSAQFTLNQYKCYPFSELQNLDSNSSVVYPAGIPMDRAVKELESASPDNGISFSAIIYWILGILGVMAILGALYAIFSYAGTSNQIPVEDLPITPNPF